MGIDAKVQELLDGLQLAVDRRVYRRKDFFEPYLKQEEFCDLGGVYRERLLSGGNQSGKSDIGAYEFACHVTGEYPEWWMGKRFENNVVCWACSTDTTSQRDVIQKKLLGEFEKGTGFIPRENILETVVGHGTGGALNQMRVRHKSGGTSIITFKNYTQERENWQGATLDFLWFDEEPPEDLFGEARMRLREGGMLYLTMTPLKGMSNVAKLFFEKPDRKYQAPVVYLTLDEITHYTEEEKQFRIASMKPHEREARRRGVPTFGAGRVFEAEETFIREEPIQFPPAHWAWLWGIDFGTYHPFAAVLLAHDREADIVHVVHAIRMANTRVLDHCRAMKSFGWIKVAWPHDGNQRDATDLTALATQYKREGLRMLPSHATFVEGGYSTEAGIAEMNGRFNTGRLKVAKHLSDWFGEYRNYHRSEKDGLIVKTDDDLMSATRVGIMDLRRASVRMHKPDRIPGQTQIAIGTDDDPW